MTREEAMQIYQRLIEIQEAIEDFEDDHTALVLVLDLQADMMEIGNPLNG